MYIYSIPCIIKLMPCWYWVGIMYLRGFVDILNLFSKVIKYLYLLIIFSNTNSKINTSCTVNTIYLARVFVVRSTLKFLSGFTLVFLMAFWKLNWNILIKLLTPSRVLMLWTGLNKIKYIVFWLILVRFFVVCMQHSTVLLCRRQTNIFYFILRKIIYSSNIFIIFYCLPFIYTVAKLYFCKWNKTEQCITIQTA